MAERPRSNNAQVILASCAIITLVLTSYNYFSSSKNNVIHGSFPTNPKKSELVEKSKINYLDFKLRLSKEEISLYESRRGLIFANYSPSNNEEIISNTTCHLKTNSIYSSKFSLKFYINDVSKNTKFFAWILNSDYKIIQSFSIKSIKLGWNVIDFSGYIQSDTYTIEIGAAIKNKEQKVYYYNSCHIEL